MQRDGTMMASGSTSTSRFVINSTDVISDMRINVSEEGLEGKVIWYKERFLSDEEIIEHVIHNPTSTICWTIHRPRSRGWYIRIRAPSFPPGVFIQMIPVPPTSPHHVDASLTFSSRTNVPKPRTRHTKDFSVDPNFAIDDDDEEEGTSAVHSYPPTSPPSASHPVPLPIMIHPPSPTESEFARNKRKSKRVSSSLTPPRSQITDFILSPETATAQQQAVQTGFFARALSALRGSAPSHSNSFQLCRIPTACPPSLSQSQSQSQSQSPPPPYTSSPSLPIASSSSSSSSSSTPLQTQTPVPVLYFHDRTPTLLIRSITGVIEIDKVEERLLGVDTSFWIAVALTYLEFLEERESYLAALSD